MEMKQILSWRYANFKYNFILAIFYSVKVDTCTLIWLVISVWLYLWLYAVHAKGLILIILQKLICV